MKRYGWGLIVVSVIMAVWLTGCGKSGDNANGSSSSPAPTSAAATATPAPTKAPEASAAPTDAGPSLDDVAKETATISIYADKPSDEAMGMLKAKFPNYTFNWLTDSSELELDEMVATGITVDIVDDNVYSRSWTDLGLQYDMSDLIKKYNFDMDRLDPDVIDPIIKAWDGKIYGLPYTFTRIVLDYNKDIFDKFGIAYPKDGMTWSEIADLSNQFTRVEDGQQYYGLAVSLSQFLAVNQASLRYTDATTHLANIETEDWKNYLQETLLSVSNNDAYKQLALKEEKYPDKDMFYKDQNTAMFLNQSLLSDSLLALNWDWATIPELQDKPGVGSGVYAHMYGITAQSKVKDEAFAVIDYMMSDEYQAFLSKSGSSTALKDESIRNMFYQDAGDAVKGKNLSIVYTQKIAPMSALGGYEKSVATALREELPTIVSGAEDLNTGLRKIGETANEDIQAELGQ